ncbi:MAG TPA: DUF1573 domain-containing protein [Ferruginibacter sp.]|nr:DUF1573 domain-containing protein [Ferruginibacter sp.]
MKQIVTLLIFCLGSLAMYAQENDNHSHNVNAQTDVSIKTGDDILAVNQPEHDFGKIPQGKPVTYVFEVTNTGKTPFKLDNVQASCGCTTPVWDKENPIPAGGSSKITVGYNAAAEGVFTKSITITYNSTQTKQITIKGEVWKTPAVSAPINAGLNDLKN